MHNFDPKWLLGMAAEYRVMAKLAYGEFMGARCDCGKPTRCTKCRDCSNKTADIFEQASIGVFVPKQEDIAWYRIMLNLALSCSSVAGKQFLEMKCKCCQKRPCCCTFCYDCYVKESDFFKKLAS